MNREVHVRIWERPEVRVPRATRQEEQPHPHEANARCSGASSTFRRRLLPGCGWLVFLTPCADRATFQLDGK